MEKTDLRKILSISGEHGLFEYVAQAKAGLIAENLETKRRTTFGAQARVSSLADISIYTETAEMPLKEVFRAIAAKLDGGESISSKAASKDIEKFFGEVVPEYDADRFYVSHMKKVLDWYNCLRQFATLDFADEEEETEEQDA
ncbi:MAG: DUF5606 domain-containing protein [Bacteroidales bacterium]|nr:DUF5606 domain-containing protein [Bacteroidales bacterium]